MLNWCVHNSQRTRTMEFSSMKTIWGVYGFRGFFYVCIMSRFLQVLNKVGYTNDSDDVTRPVGHHTNGQDIQLCLNVHCTHLIRKSIILYNNVHCTILVYTVFVVII